MVSLHFSWCLLVISFSTIIHVNSQLKEFFKWTKIQYTSIEGDGDTDDYTAASNVLFGATHYKDKVILTLPRMLDGIPATLNYVNFSSGKSPQLIPFPSVEVNSLEPNRLADPNRIVSVYRSSMDSCNRLWFVDTGMLEYPRNNQTQVQRPSIWVWDMDSNTLLNRFDVPTSIVANGNGMASITVDSDADSCDDAYAYIPDLSVHRLYVYSLKQNLMWSFVHNYFSFDPLMGEFNVSGLQYEWNDGVFSATLSNKQSDGFKTLYFHAMVSNSEFAVSTKVLQNQTNTKRLVQGDDFLLLGKRGPQTQSNMHELDPSTGIIFYTQVATSGIACWNSNTTHQPKNFDVLQLNNTAMIYPADLTIDQDGYVWMVTNGLPISVYSDYDLSQVNFRVWRASVKDLIRKSICTKA